MLVALKFRGDEVDVDKLVSIISAIIESDAFREVDIVDFYEEKE